MKFVLKPDYTKVQRQTFSTHEDVVIALCDYTYAMEQLDFDETDRLFRKYYDVEIKLSADISSECFEIVDELFLKTSKQVVMEESQRLPVSICTSSCRGYIDGKKKTPTSKCSFFYIVDESTDRETMRQNIKKCNSMWKFVLRRHLEQSPSAIDIIPPDVLALLWDCNPFDESVYHRKQFIRMVTQIKKGEENLPLRVRRLLHGNIEDTFVQVPSDYIFRSLTKKWIEYDTESMFRQPVKTLSTIANIVRSQFEILPSSTQSIVRVLLGIQETEYKHQKLVSAIEDYGNFVKLAMYIADGIKKASSIGDAKLRVLVEWFYRDFFAFFSFRADKKSGDRVGNREDKLREVTPSSAVESKILSWFVQTSESSLDIQNTDGRPLYDLYQRLEDKVYMASMTFIPTLAPRIKSQWKTCRRMSDPICRLLLTSYLASSHVEIIRLLSLLMIENEDERHDPQEIHENFGRDCNVYPPVIFSREEEIVDLIFEMIAVVPALNDSLQRSEVANIVDSVLSEYVTFETEKMAWLSKRTITQDEIKRKKMTAEEVIRVTKERNLLYQKRFMEDYFEQLELFLSARHKAFYQIVFGDDHERETVVAHLHVLGDQIQQIVIQSNEFRSLLPMENRRGIIERMIFIAKAERLWLEQYPYKEALEKLWYTANEDAMIMRILISFHAPEIFRPECIQHHFSRAFNDVEAAGVVHDLYPYWTIDPDSLQLYVYDFMTGMWSSQEHIHRRIIGSFANFLYTTEGKITFTYGASMARITRVITAMMSRVDVSTTFPFLDMKATSKKKLLFPNGYYDGEQDLFYPCKMYERNRIFCYPSIFFFASTTDEYNDEWTESEMQEIQQMRHDLFFAAHSKEVGEYNMQSIALAIMAVPKKAFYSHVGLTNSGKSTIKNLLEKSFGQYICTGSLDDFAIIKDDRRDAGMVNSFTYRNFWKRLYMCSEKGSSRILSVEQLKLHSSGQEDAIKTRTQYKEDMVVDVHYMLFFFTNTPIVVDKPSDPGYIDRGNFINWNMQFLPPDQITDPSMQLPKKPEIAEWKLNKRKRQMFVSILLDSYRDYLQNGMMTPPQELIQNKIEEVGCTIAETTKDIVEKILFAFILDGNPNSEVWPETIEEKGQTFGFTRTRMGQRITRYLQSLNLGFDAKTMPIRSVERRRGGKKEHVWIGMRNRPSILISDGDYLTDLAQWESLMKTHRGAIPEYVISELVWVSNHYRDANLSEDEEQRLLQSATSFQKQQYEMVKQSRKRPISSTMLGNFNVPMRNVPNESQESKRAKPY